MNQQKIIYHFIKHILCFYVSNSCIISQAYFSADPYHLLQLEKAQFQNQIPFNSNNFRPFFFKTDSSLFNFTFNMEQYYNNSAPNQENMDVRYFSKGIGSFKSFNFTYISPYFLFIAEPYQINSNYYKVDSIKRDGPYSVLNDNSLIVSKRPPELGFRNLLAFIHYKGIGIGWQEGNRWWGPGIHTSFQMTNNAKPIPAQIIGTMKEIRFGRLGFYGLYTFGQLNNIYEKLGEYYTALNAQLTWYGPLHVSLGFSRNFISGGKLLPNGYEWNKNDARKIIFEGFFISNLLENEYTVGGHDEWDQTLSAYLTITFPKRDLKLYTEIGFNDNRMYFADFLSQPDHSMATIFGIRDYGIGKNNNWLWGFEWTNLMITYSSRHRVEGPGTWYIRPLYDYSTYYGRRWGAHSGTDSDDWYLYIGYLSDKLMLVPSLNYERHGIVSHRPAEVKLELSVDSRYKIYNTWLGLRLEKQFEAFLGFPDYFYVDKLNEPTGYYSEDKTGLANSRSTTTLILSLSKTINY